MSAINSYSLQIGLVREQRPGERRVALVPHDIRRLSAKAVVLIEREAGRDAGFPDDAYSEAGARVTSRDDVISGSELLVKVRPPEAPQALRPGSILVSLGGRDSDLAGALRARSVTHLGLERLPRTTRAQSMDVLSSQAAIAGYAAVLEGARVLDVLLPMLTTAAGGIKPAKMIALGAGVAGLQAIATARRLGAITYGFDVREAAREQVESLGAKFVFPKVELAPADAAGGYAGEQSADEQARLRRALTEHLAPMQLIVTSAQIPGKPAPLLIDAQTIAALQPGTVIVDLAAESGGNCAHTRPDEMVTTSGGIRILGPTNMPSAAATDASRFFSGNVRALLDHLIDDDGRLRLEGDDPITVALLAGQAPTRLGSGDRGKPAP
jgi:NAD(P) transhydrogenase subunit alpha